MKLIAFYNATPLKIKHSLHSNVDPQAVHQNNDVETNFIKRSLSRGREKSWEEVNVIKFYYVERKCLTSMGL